MYTYTLVKTSEICRTISTSHFSSTMLWGVCIKHKCMDPLKCTHAVCSEVEQDASIQPREPATITPEEEEAQPVKKLRRRCTEQARYGFGQ